MTTPIYGSTSCSTLASDDSSLENSKPKHSELSYNYRKERAMQIHKHMLFPTGSALKFLCGDFSSMPHSSCTMSPCMPWSLCTCADGNYCWPGVSNYSFGASTMPHKNISTCKWHSDITSKVRKSPSKPCHIGDTLGATRATTISAMLVV